MANFYVRYNWYHENLNFNDITIRKILRVRDYQIIPFDKNKINNLKNIKYFLHSSDEICIGFYISTIVGKINVPVISMEDIILKKKIKQELIDYMPIIKKKSKYNMRISLILYSTLPIEIINYIMLYY
jgi:hypothetical protein